MAIWLSLCFFSTALAFDEELMDTQLETEELNWLALPSSGWEEAVAVDKSFQTTRTYRVCNVELPNQDNWLRSSFIQRGEARLVYVDLRFSVRDCTSFQVAAGFCRETFTLYYRQSDSEETVPAAGAEQLRAAYAKVQEVAAEHVFSLGGSGRVNRVTVRVWPLSKAGFRLAFRDRGACINLLSVRVYFKKCPATVANLAHFPEVATGDGPSSLGVAAGHCVLNAEEDSVPLKMFCGSEGDWVGGAGACRCRRGYRSNEELTACTEIEDYVTLTRSQSSRDVPRPSCSQSEEQTALLRANGRLLEEQARTLGQLVRAVGALNDTLSAILRRLPGLLEGTAESESSSGADPREEDGAPN
ncbi:ephrin type-B receptor 3-like [Hypanus sabinus]|uniref:ephrin type-B receptor 3-like n=1 Tax=Hypanus sabinus TaxID=79690 RepID=UPI0028C3E52F|nr:ephrin type-B receptor 3-like [Hypanus sabinus]